MVFNRTLNHLQIGHLFNPEPFSKVFSMSLDMIQKLSEKVTNSTSPTHIPE